MRSVRRVAEHDDVPDVPGLVRHLREVEPERAVREQLAPAQLVGEQLLAEREALLLVHRVEPGRAPHRLRALDDEGRHPLVVRVRVGVEETVLGLAEGERERVEDVVGAEPDVLAALGPNLRPEAPEATNEAVRAVGADDEIGVGQPIDLSAELELGADLAAARLQDLEQPLASDRREGVTTRAQLAPAEADVDPVPARERVGDLEVSLRIRVAQRAERLLAEDDAEAERGVRRVALEHAHVDAAIGPTQEDREVEPCRAAADDLDPHARPSPATATGRRSRPPPPPGAAACTVLSGPVLQILCPPAPHPQRRPRNARAIRGERRGITTAPPGAAPARRCPQPSGRARARRNPPPRSRGRNPSRHGRS